MAKARGKIAQTVKRRPRLKILVSSVVYGYEDLLESIYALLETFDYEVIMSYKGTIPIDPDDSAMASCCRNWKIRTQSQLG